MNGTESERLRMAVGRLMDGQREALEVLRQALDEDAPAEDALGDLEDILQGALEDVRHPGGGGGGRSVVAPSAVISGYPDPHRRRCKR